MFNLPLLRGVMAKVPDRQATEGDALGAKSGAGEGQLAIPDYGPSFRPSRILEVMHEAVRRFEDHAIAFYPLIDSIILLLGKPLALIFHVQAPGSVVPEPFFLTYPEVDIDELRLRYHTDPSLASTLISLPAPIGGQERFFVSIANIREERLEVPGSPSPRLRLEPYGIEAVAIDESFPPSALHGEQLDVWLLKRLLLELDATREGQSKLSVDVVAALYDGLRSRLNTPDRHCETPGSPWEEEEAAEWEKTRDAIMDDHWRDILDQSLPRATIRGGNAASATVRDRLSFLCVFRFALPGERLRFGKFSYGARIVLSRRQRAAVREWLATAPTFRSTGQGTSQEKAHLFEGEFGSDPDAVIRALELPLGMNYRSISDTHFGSGFIDFAPEATYAKEGPRSGTQAEVGDRREPADDAEQENDRLRKVAERLVLDEIGSRVFYVPIHVGGIPWLGLLILEDEIRGADVSDTSWEESYHLYRGPVTTIGQQFRLSSHNAYSSALCAALNQGLTSSSRDVFGEIGRQWQRLSAFFPFEAPTLSAGYGQDTDIDFPGGQKAALGRVSNPNPCFSRALPYDELRLPTLQHDLKTVLETVVAKRLSALALQESAWAHDVKNWTNPILTELYALWQQNPNDAGVYRALVHARILNASAFARQTSGPRQREGKPGQDALDTYLAYASEANLEKLLRLLTDLLLATHADNPINQSQFELIWPQKRAVRIVMDELSQHIDGRNGNTSDEDPTLIIGMPVVIWPISLLREVIHNIEINNPVEGVLGYSQVHIDYHLQRDDRCISLCIIQRNLESIAWESRFASGLQKANQLYGPDGANVGWIDENPVLIQKDIEVVDSSGQTISVVEISYALRVRFFLGA